MRIQINNQKGFTLLEMIVVLILVGILAAMAGIGIVTAVQGYIFSKENAAFSGKAQMAIARINRELLECYTCKGSGTINLPFSYSNPLGPRQIVYYPDTDQKIKLSDGTTANENILLDNVNSFSLAYDSADDNRSIIVTLILNHPGDGMKTFTTKVHPRNSSY